MCRQIVRTEGPIAGHPLYLAFLIGRTKSTLNYDISRLFTHGHFLLSAPTAVRVPPVNAHAVCILQATHALHQVRQQGCPSSLALSSRGTEAGKRDSGHSPFRGPARGRSPRARISILAPFQQTAAAPIVDRSSSIWR